MRTTSANERHAGSPPARPPPLGRVAALIVVVFALVAALSPVTAVVGAFVSAVVASIVSSRAREAARDHKAPTAVVVDPAVAVDAVHAGPRLPTTLILWNVRFFVIAMSFSAQSAALSFLALGLLGISTFVAVIAGSDERASRQFSVPMLLLVLATSSCFIWFTDPRSRYLILAAFALLVIATAATQFEEVRAGLAMAAFDAVGIYLLASLVAHFGLGLRPRSFVELPNTVVGPFDARITFPFSSGPTAPAAMAAAYLAGYLAMVRYGLTTDRVLRTLCLASGVVVALASNGRVALLSGAAVGAFAYFWPRVLTRAAVPIMLVMLFVPVWWPAIDSAPLPVAARTWLASKPFFDRGEADRTVETLSGRTKIWDRFYGSYESLPTSRKLFGYGVGGHVKSGVSRSYAAVFGTYANPRGITPHSSVLQQSLDGGIVGVAILLMVLARSASRLGSAWRRSVADRASAPCLACVAMLVVFATTAGTDSSLAPGLHQEQFWATLVIVCVASLYRPVRAVDA